MKRDYAAWYRRITAPIRKRKGGAERLGRLDRILTDAMYAAYPLMLAILLARGTAEGGAGEGIRTVLPFVLIPGISFVLLSIVRDRINRPRPYETFDLDPLIHKDTRGHSMPSRHVFSSAVISMCLLRLSPAAGIAGFVITALSMAVRVLGGVHYPEDAAAGAACGIAAGLLLWCF